MCDLRRALSGALLLCGLLVAGPAIADTGGSDDHARTDTRLASAGAAEAVYDSAALSRLPAPDGGAAWTCLTEALYFEARGERLRGIYGVAEVILNRVDTARYPDTVCAVINQGTGRKHACQFSYTCDGLPETVADAAAWERVGRVARLMLDGAERGLTSGATHYHTRAVSPRWSRVFPRTVTIGAHHFYREPTRVADAR